MFVAACIPKATASQVSYHMDPPRFTGKHADRDRREHREFVAAHTPTDEDIETAAQAKAWIESLDATPDQDYLWNCSIIVEAEMIASRRFGLACSIVGSYLREQGKLAERKAKKSEAANSEWIGTIKKRETFTLTLTGERRIEGDFGTSFLLSFTDPDDNIVKWFSSGSADYVGMTVGGTYKLKATPKSHDTWNDVKETRVNRGVVVETVSGEGDNG